MSPWKVILATAVIFGTGSVTGALMIKRQDRVQNVTSQTNAAPVRLGNFSAPNWQLQRKEFLHRMDKQLQLTPDQRQHIEKILSDSKERTKPVWEQIAPQLREEMKHVREEIRQELNATQQKKFEQLLKPRSSLKKEITPRRRPQTNSLPSATTNQI